jgi:flavin-dependent dehydrogenase
MADYDVIVVGGRVAGSLVATLLGERGHRVLVLERASFPSDTLSTHFFRAPALRAFDAAGVGQQVLQSAPRLRVNFNVIDEHVFPEPVDRPEDFPFYMCVRRITLDDILVRRAQSTPGVEFVEGARARQLLRQDGRVAGVSWQMKRGISEASARAVVGADGVHSFLAREVQPEAEHEEPVNRAMYYGYFRGIEPQDGPAAEFHYRGNHLVYVFPCDDELTLVASSVPIAKFGDFKRDPEGSFTAEIEAMPAVAPRLRKAERVGPLRGTGNIPGYLRVPYGPGWALVGDAGMVMDPWSGQGIDQGSTHATFLADALNEFLEGRQSWSDAMAGFHAARNEFSLKTYRRTCEFARDLRPMTQAALQRRGLT